MALQNAEGNGSGRSLLEYGRERLSRLGLSAAPDLAGFLNRLEERSRRKLVAHPMPEAAERRLEISTVRLSTSDADHVFYPTAASPSHRMHLLLRAFIYTAMLNGSEGISAADLQRTMPDVPLLQVHDVLPLHDTAASTADESEMLATLAGERFVRLHDRAPRMMIDDLTPLWASLVDSPGDGLLAQLDTEDLKLYRMVIEIAEARLALRLFRHPSTEQRARSIARQASLGPDLTVALIEVAHLDSARQARLEQHSNAVRPEFTGSPWNVDYASEISRLMHMSEIYRRRELRLVMQSAF